MSQKRQRTFESGTQWMKCSQNEDKGILTKSCVEQIFNRAFGLDTFPGWEEPTAGHLIVRGKQVNTTYTVIFSYWPNTGNILFQGKTEERAANKAKWDKARQELRI